MIHHEYIRKTTKDFLEHNAQAIVLCSIDDGFFNTIESLSKHYPKRIELPCSENASVAMALGAACCRMPIVCFQRLSLVY